MSYTISRLMISEMAWFAKIQTSNHTEVRPAEHGGIEINFDASGRLSNRIAGKEIDLTPGKLLVFNARVEHTEIHKKSTLEDRAIILYDEYLEKFLGHKRAVELLFRSPMLLADPKIQDIARQVHILSQSPFVPPTLFNQLCDEFTLTLLESCKESRENLETSYHPGLVRRIKQRLFESIDNPHLNLDQLATEFCMSKYHFLRTFKNTAGISPMKYLRKIRAEWVAQKLVNKNLSVTELAFATGFQSLSSFYEAFGSLTPLPPGEFLKQVKAKPSDWTTETFSHMAVKL